MRFNLDQERNNGGVNGGSIEFLRGHGTNFDRLRDHGCDSVKVVDDLKSLFRDKNVTWVTFQG